MRVAPFALIPLVLLVGCGKGGGAESMASSDRMSGAVASSAKASTKAAYTAGAAEAVGGVGAARAQAKSAAYEAPTPVSRMVVRNGELALEVKDVKITEAQVRGVATSMGGSVDASQGSGLAGPSPSLSMTLRVPESRFDRAMTALEDLSKRQNKSVTSEDVTSQAVDMEARVKSLRVQEDAYRAILAGTRRIADVLEVQAKLTEVRTEIEQIVAQRRALGDQAARSTIVVSLTQVVPVAPVVSAPPAPSWFASTLGEATGSLFAISRGFASLLLWIAVLAPVWIPVGLIAWFGWRRWRTTAPA